MVTARVDTCSSTAWGSGRMLSNTVHAADASTGVAVVAAAVAAVAVAVVAAADVAASSASR